MLKKLYDWVLHWSQTRFAAGALFLIAVAESSVFPIPPDVLLIIMVLAERSRWRRYALICTAGSILGGMIGYGIGWGFWSWASPWFYRYVFSETLFLKVKTMYQAHGFWIVFTAGLTPIPYKVFTIASGVYGIHPAVFLAASVLSRGGRFFIVAGLLRVFGAYAKNFIDRYFNLFSILFVLMLIGGFVFIKYFFR